MKPTVKITQYFYQQAPDLSSNYANKQIEEFARSLFDTRKCTLCKQEYELSRQDKIPRILIHCGHTFCGECLQKFLIKNRIRCPMCLKLIKKVSSVQQLPINHTIYAQIAQQIGEPVEEGYKYLCTHFTMATGNRLRQQNTPETDEQSGLKYCCFHTERVEHFFCLFHQVPGCRECMETTHKGSKCKALDLFDTETKKLMSGLNNHKN